jgi:AcrR family transcriptional regulator
LFETLIGAILTKAIQDLSTRERLLDEAEFLFAENGYHAVTIRAVTHAAGCNLAAVNYHFGNKTNLYQEVFRTRWAARARLIQLRFRELMARHTDQTKETIVDSLARAFLAGPLTEEERRRHFLLMTREIVRPTDTFGMMADDIISPFFREIMNALKPCMPHIRDENRLMLYILSIFAMVLYFNFARQPVALAGRYDDDALQGQLLQHIIAFSLNGLGMDTGRLTA